MRFSTDLCTNTFLGTATWHDYEANLISRFSGNWLEIRASLFKEVSEEALKRKDTQFPELDVVHNILCDDEWWASRSKDHRKAFQEVFDLTKSGNSFFF
jgi:hypothetical protein